MQKWDLSEGFMGPDELGWAAPLPLAPCLQVWLDQTEVAYFLVSLTFWYTRMVTEETQQSKQKQDNSSDLCSSGWGGGQFGMVIGIEASGDGNDWETQPCLQLSLCWPAWLS